MNHRTAKYAFLWLLLTIPILTAASFSYVKLRENLTSLTLARREALARLSSSTIKERMDRLTDLGKSFASRVVFRELIAAGKWDDAVLKLKTIPDEFPIFDHLFLTDPTGIVRVDLPPLPGWRGRSVSDQDWYRSLSQDWRPRASDAYERFTEPQLNVLDLAVPIKKDDGDILGILVLQIPLSGIRKWTEEIDAGPDGFVYLADRSGTLLAHPRYDTLFGHIDFSQVPFVIRARQSRSGVESALNPVDQTMELSAFAHVPDYDWAVVVAEPAATAFEDRDKTLRNVTTVYAVSFLLMALLSSFIVRLLSKSRAAENEVKLLNLSLEKSVLNLAAANKEMEAFSYSVSHDLKAPLRSMQGFGTALLESYGDKLDATGRKYAQLIVQAGERMDQIIEAQLQLSKISRHELVLEQIDLTGIARDLVDDLARATPDRNVDILIGEGLTCVGDKKLMITALENLIGNAWKYTSKTERARIEFGKSETEGKETVFFIRDNGAGFNPAYANKLFVPFQRLHVEIEFSGTGIGLATVRRIIHRHGGRIWAEGNVGQGAAFSFTIGTPNETHSKNHAPASA
jgi:signal transduction histidine kinase